MELKIADDDGFIALINAAGYQGFVNEDWEFDELMDHFVNQMNTGNLVIWQSSNDGGGNWLVSIQDQSSGTNAFRRFEHFIDVTDGQLYLTNYADLTMAAQYTNEPLPAKHNADLRISLDNGRYKLTVKQMFDPDDYDDISKVQKRSAFEIIVEPALHYQSHGVNDIYWRE